MLLEEMVQRDEDVLSVKMTTTKSTSLCAPIVIQPTMLLWRMEESLRSASLATKSLFISVLTAIIILSLIMRYVETAIRHPVKVVDFRLRENYSYSNVEMILVRT